MIDADADLRSALAQQLRDADYAVAEASDGLEGLRLVFEQRPAAAVIDLDVPAMDGAEFTRIVRAVSDMPIIVLGSGTKSERVVRVLDLGADDFVEKPFSVAELVARVRAAIRRAARSGDGDGENTVVQVGDLRIDREARVVTKAGKVVQLTPTEYRLLDALALRAGKVAPHRYLLSTVWGEEYVDDTHYLRIYVGYLRNKLEDDPSNPQYLINEWGTGYRLAAVPPREVSAVT